MMDEVVLSANNQGEGSNAKREGGGWFAIFKACGSGAKASVLFLMPEG
jgi:hypothetical protein